MHNILGPVILAFFIVILGTPLVKRLAIKINALDRPDSRKVHNGIMPRLGGLAIFFGFFAVVILTQDLTREIIGLLLGGAVIVLVGVLDDTRGLPPRIKLLGQILASCVVLSMGVRVEFVTNPFQGIAYLGSLGTNLTIALAYMSIPLTIIWITGITNAINLIDGLDGLAGGVSAIAAITLGLVTLFEGYPQVAILAFILAASTLGFLKYNFYPASIFMGDTGAMFLGFNLSSIAIIGLTKSATVISLFLPVLILGIPIMDTLFAICRRYISGKPIFAADKDHLHHRLLELGLSHKKTVLAIYGVSILLGLSALITAVVTTAQGVIIMVITASGVILGADKLGVLKGRTAGQEKEARQVAK